MASLNENYFGDNDSAYERKSKTIGVIVSLILHSLLILFLCLYYLHHEDLPEEGLAVNLGAPDAGADDLFEPTPMDEIMSSEPEAAEPEPVQPAAAADAPELPTQDIEETVNIKTAKKEEKKKKEPTPEELEKQRLAKLQQQEAARKAAEEAKRKAEEERKAAEIKAKMGGAFSKSKGTDAASKGTGGGTTGGVKGNENGDKGGTEGSAKWGNGNAWSLEGRSLIGQKVKPENKTNEEGTVVVVIMVDRQGKVVKAYRGTGTNTDRKELIDAAIEAAKKTVFSPIDHGPETQQGTITYKYDIK